ncbi:MAG: hypothetical protein ACKVOM_00395 [Ferruginibacter sp.]
MTMPAKMKSYFIVVFIMAFVLSCKTTKEDTCKGTVKRDCMCTMDYKPVCSCDEKTYSNVCAAECAGGKIVYRWSRSINNYDIQKNDGK